MVHKAVALGRQRTIRLIPESEKRRLGFLDVQDDQWTWRENTAFLDGATADQGFAIPVFLHAASPTSTHTHRHTHRHTHTHTHTHTRQRALISAFLSSSPNSVGLSVLATEIGYLLGKGADLVWRPDGNLLAVCGSVKGHVAASLDRAVPDVLRALHDCC